MTRRAVEERKTDGEEENEYDDDQERKEQESEVGVMKKCIMTQYAHDITNGNSDYMDVVLLLVFLFEFGCMMHVFLLPASLPHPADFGVN